MVVCVCGVWFVSACDGVVWLRCFYVCCVWLARLIVGFINLLVLQFKSLVCAIVVFSAGCDLLACCLLSSCCGCLCGFSFAYCLRFELGLFEFCGCALLVCWRLYVSLVFAVLRLLAFVCGL